jgi:hypothetical protein
MEVSHDKKMAQASAQTDLANNLVCMLFPITVNGAGAAAQTADGKIRVQAPSFPSSAILLFARA